MFHAVWFIIRGFWRFLLGLFYTTIAPYNRWRLRDIMIHSATWTEINQHQYRATGRNGMPCRKLSQNPITDRRYLSSDGNRTVWNMNVTNYNKYACSGCIACWTVPFYSTIQEHGIKYANVLLRFFEGHCKVSFLCSNPHFGCQLFSKSGKYQQMHYSIRFLQLKHCNSGMYRPYVGHNHGVYINIFIKVGYKQIK
jgi:hypothetical protein